jgi:hypothetical protein
MATVTRTEFFAKPESEDGAIGGWFSPRRGACGAEERPQLSHCRDSGCT